MAFVEVLLTSAAIFYKKGGLGLSAADMPADPPETELLASPKVQSFYAHAIRSWVKPPTGDKNP